MSTVSSTSSSSTAASTGYTALQASSTGTGIDYSALIDAKIAAKTARADKLDTKITANETKISAYENMQSLLQTVYDSIDGLRNRTASTGSSTTTNLFGQRTAYLSGGGSTSADDVMAVTVDDDTETGTYSVEVQQLATRNKLGSGTQTSKTTALSLSGTFTLGVEGGSAVSIDVSESDSLQDISDAINAQKSASGVGASIVKVSDTSYQLILTATDTGKAITMSDGSDSVLQSLGVADSSGNAANELVAAQDAILSIDGVTVTRSSNTIDDAIPGVSIDLYAADVGNPISVEVSTDLSSIKSAISSFVDAYNSFRDFVTEQTATNSDGTKADSATLFTDSLLRQVTSSVSGILNGTVTSSDGSKLSLSDLGITMGSDNTLSLDETTLNTALTDNLDEVKTLLGLNMTTSSSNLQLLRYNNSLSKTSFTLDIEAGSDGKPTSASIDGDTSLFTVTGNRIIGNTGTAFEGLVFVYSGASASVDVSFSEGLADKLNTTLSGIVDTTDGDIQTQIDELKSNDDDMQTRSDTIRNNAEDYRTQLTSYYARLEQKAEAANLLLQQLTYKDSDSSSS